MAFQYEKIPGFKAGLINRPDPRDIRLTDPRGLSKAQNISLDIGGKIRTIGGLEDFTKVDGATALTQTAKICPGSGLFPYGSDHWKGTITATDLLDAGTAVSLTGEADNVGDWVTAGGGAPVLDSVDDTDSGAIATNGGDWIFKLTSAQNVGIKETATTVVGQGYLCSVDVYNVDAPYVYLTVGTSSGAPVQTPHDTTQGSWFTLQIEYVAVTTSTRVDLTAAMSAAQTIYADDFYLTKIPTVDLDTNWVALADAANAQVDLYNVNDDALGFVPALLDFGTVFSYVGTADKINFPTTKTITDANSEFLNQGIRSGDIRVISGCTSETANNIMFVVEHVTAGTITARGNPFTVAADEDGTVTLTKYNPTAFHYVNEALRASPANGGIALRPKHYSFADRIHFEGAGSSERKFASWYANDVGPVPPTDIAFDAAVDSGLSGNLTAGAGWEVGMTVTADDGEWPVGTYIIACSFIYDDGQESALYVPSTDVAMTAITEGASLTLCAKADTATDYDERISGGRVYCRIDETDDPWTLLMDISMAKGARATLSGTYNTWREGATADDVYTYSFVSKRQNIDSYESLAGIDPTTPVEVFDGDNAFWNTSVIARNRCFIGSVRYTAAGGSLSHFRDRILYSTAGAYDTFPIDNYIDVVQGDAEDYVKLGAYGNDLLCFKQRTLYIIDISDPDPAGWQMKQDANKGKYPFRGIKHPGAYFETPSGPAWCNKFGVFLYNGSEIVSLLGDKIELSEHPLAYQRYCVFDGTDDKAATATSATLAYDDTTPFSLEAIFRTTDSSAANNTLVGLWQSASAGNDDFINLQVESGKLYLYMVEDWSAQRIVVYTDSTFSDGEWHHVVVTFDGSSVKGGFEIYVDGALQTVTRGSVGVVTGFVATNTLGIGNNAKWSSATFFDGDISLGRLWNRELSAAEVLALYNGQPVLAADQWGAPTELMPNQVDRDFSGASAWTDVNLNSYNETDDLSIAGDLNEYCELPVASAPMTATYHYRLIFDVANISGAWAIQSFTGTQLFGGVTANGTNKINFTVDSGITGGLRLVAGPSGASGDFDNFSLIRTGCVAEYAPKGIGDATWTDQSDNSLDGTVVGATAIFEDSWRKFYTDYSILGYHGRTNQIIVMRDCTGRWSSGQDYADVWVVDLDTGASTAGRRIFTKGIAYSNFSTDWRQDLIIAEQTSSTLVTIKKFTDEPQSQAVGLIDIRTADMEFGNPAFRKDIDAIIITYKSSAAQTNPVSYALEDNDAHTAWTRLTGNFNAETNWEKLVIQPTPIECDSIRLKIDNPSSAGTIEINDITIRYTEIPEALS